MKKKENVVAQDRGAKKSVPKRSNQKAKALPPRDSATERKMTRALLKGWCSPVICCGLSHPMMIID